MAPSVLRTAACAGAALGASAVALSKPLSNAELLARQDVARPLPADLEKWGRGPLFVENSSLFHTTVRSQMGEYDLTIAAFDKKADQGVSGGLLAGMGWEKDHIKDLCRQFREELHSVGNFLDVGANIGTFTISLADCLKFSGGRVIAVEGMPPIADHLAMGLLANNLQDDVDLYNYAVGAPDDPKKVTMSLNPVNKGGSAVKGNKPFTEMSGDQLQDLFHPGQKVHENVEVQEYDVPLTTGDLMLRYNPSMKAISVAKVDIEGHEGHFIKGAQQFFSKYPPCVLTIELIPEWLERAGTPVEGILDMLASWGYKDVPSAAQQWKAKMNARTRTITQKNLTACLERVEKYSKEIVRSAPDYSDMNALNAVLAREARAKELDAMMARGELDWWQKPHEQRPEEVGKSDSPMIVKKESSEQLQEAQEIEELRKLRPRGDGI